MADYSLFTYANGTSFVVALVYVDDILLARTDSVFISHVKDGLHSFFNIKDLGFAMYFLDLEIYRIPPGLYVHQKKVCL